jgi:fibronectin-binding autotransporter adhesin
MKTYSYLIQKKLSLVLLFFLITSVSYATVYTANTSGNFTSAATWAGGVVPPSTIFTDQIVISSGVNVNLDTDLTVDGPFGQLDVQGIIHTTNNSDLTINLGTLTGGGNTTVDTLDINPGSTFSYTGMLTANTINAATGFTSYADIMVNQTLNLTAGTLYLVSGGSLDAANDGTIVISGGLLSVGSGGTVGLSGNYNVVYINGSSTAGIELSGSGLKDVTVDVGASGSVTLTANLSVKGTLSLMSGTLSLSGNNLTLTSTSDVDVSGSGSIYSTVTSDITINSSGGTMGTLYFESGSKADNVTINVGSGNTANIDGYLTVQGTLQLSSGKLNFSNASLTIEGNMSGTGTFIGNSSSDLTINTTGGLTNSLKFSNGGQMLDNFTIAVGSGNSVSLGSDLTVTGTLNLSGGSKLNLNGDSLALSSSSTITGSGTIVSNSSSSLTINSSGGISSLLISGDLDNFTVNSGGGNVHLAGDLKVDGTFSMQSGTIVLNSNDLTLNGHIASSGSGTISSSSTSNITITTSGNSNGTLTFETGSQANDMTINVGNNNSANIDGELTITGTLQLTSGKLNFDNGDLTINGNINGSGNLSGSNTADLTINTSGGLSNSLKFSNGGKTVNDFTISVGSGNSVSLGSDLTVTGTLNLSGGSELDLNGDSLILSSTSNITGSGTIVSNSSSSLIVNSSGGGSLTISGMMDNFTVNSGSSTVTLASDAKIQGTLNLQSGTLDLNNHDLQINGNIASSGNGEIASSSSSDVMIYTTTAPNGALRFSASDNTVGDLKINITNGGTAKIESDLYVNDSLKFTKGKLDIDSNALIINSSGTITGYSKNCYIITDVNGYLEMYVTAGGADTAKFPVGTSSHYAPAYIYLNSGSLSGDVSVGVVKDVMSNGTMGTDLSSSESMVDATWHVESSIVTNLNMAMKVMWSSAMEVHGFNRHKAYISHYTTMGWWDTISTSGSLSMNGMYSIERNGITSLSPFAVFDNHTVSATVAATDDTKFDIYPNPTNDHITIQNKAEYAEPITVEIYTSTGKLIGTYKMNDLLSTISVNGLMSGSYFIKFYNDNTNTIKRFTKL